MLDTVPARGALTHVSEHVLLCRAGVGSRRAAAAGQGLIDAGVGALVSWGCAAGLQAGRPAGTLVLADRVVRPTHRNESREHAGTGDETRSPTQAIASTWLDRLATRLAPELNTVRGAIADAGGILRTADDKRALACTGADAADMETAAVAEVAARAGVPWVAVRAVADGHDATVPASVVTALDDDGRLRVMPFAAALARRPADALALPRLARGYRAALTALRTVRRLAGPTLLAPGLEALSPVAAPGVARL